MRQHTLDQGPQGNTRSYGGGFMYTFLNTLGLGKRFSRNRIAAIIKEVDPDGVRRRQEEISKSRGEYVVPGPNWVWSIDGYCKLRFAGIEIYAGVDGYSRFVPWLYVGICNGCAVSITSLLFISLFLFFYFSSPILILAKTQFTNLIF
jgi:hypothetical protein